MFSVTGMTATMVAAGVTFTVMVVMVALYIGAEFKRAVH